MRMEGSRARDLVGERFFALSPDLMCIADRDRKIVAANPAFETVLGWRAEDLVGMSFADFIHPDEVAAIDFAQMEVLDGKSLVEFVNEARHFGQRVRDSRSVRADHRGVIDRARHRRDEVAGQCTGSGDQTVACGGGVPR